MSDEKPDLIIGGPPDEPLIPFIYRGGPLDGAEDDVPAIIVRAGSGTIIQIEDDPRSAIYHMTQEPDGQWAWGFIEMAAPDNLPITLPGTHPN